MNRKDYLAKRDLLMNKANDLINAGDFDGFNAVEKEINDLDEKFDAAAKAQASLDALKDDHRIKNLADYAVPATPGDTVIARFTAPGFAGSTGFSSPSIFVNRTDSFADSVGFTDDANSFLAQDGALGEIIRGVATGKWTNREFKNAVTTSAAGTLIPQVLSSRIIDQARALSLFASAGVPMVPMETNNLTISRVEQDPSFTFKAEGEAQTEASMELVPVELKIKTIYGYAYVTIEAIQSSKNLDQVISTTFSKALAQGMDNAMLYGQYSGSGYDSFAPAGIMNDSNINVIPAANGYDSFIKAIGAVSAANGTPMIYGINAQTDELLSMLKDSTGQYLTPPTAVSALTKVVSNQLRYDSGDGSDALVFDPNAMLIGLQETINVRVFEGDTESIKKGLVAFRVYAMVDCVTLQPKHIARITGIKQSV